MVLALGLSTAFAQEATAPSLKSKDPLQRLAAVEALRAQGGPTAEKELASVLDDRDGEVVERAALALGERGTKASIAPLVKLALEAPARRVRVAAASALARVDASRAAAEFEKRTGGKSSQRACEALAVLAPHLADAIGERALEKQLESKEPLERRAAARAFVGLDLRARESWLARLLADPDLAVRAAALDAVRAKPDPAYLESIGAHLASRALDPTIERRLGGALRAIELAAASGAAAAGNSREQVAPVLRGLLQEDEPAVLARLMRLAAVLGAEHEGRKPLAELIAKVLAQGLAHADERVRCAAVHAGAQLAHAESLKQVPALAFRDPSARVRLVALRALVETRDLHDPEVLQLAGELLGRDSDALVREEAAVALAGAPSASEAALVEAFGDPEWSVAACAAVSLGKGRNASSVPALEKLASHSDWRRRGAAVVGLTRLGLPEAIPPLIAALGDGEPAVRRTSWSYLRALAGKDLPEEVALWRDWWKESARTARFPETEAQKRVRERHGYERPYADPRQAAELIRAAYRDLDVVVLESRGDHIERLLDRLAITHRRTQAAHHAEAALQPSAVYVSNCTGEVEPADIERLQWFVRTGGYLFGSCWALHETIEKVYPGVVRKLETGSEVSDEVLAEPCVENGPYLEGVFDGGQPIYHLEGAHLIEVLEPERCEVLIDSPECATRWGGGELAVWFRAGHGLILDSVNHFDLQGIEAAPGMKTAEDRQVYALDHLGLTWEEWRATRDEDWWDSSSKAAQKVPDPSAFRLITNFVREKRELEGP